MAAPVSSAATITMPIDDFRRIEAEIDALRNEVRELRSQPRPAPASDLTLHTALDHALPVVQFATGNLDPATVRGWPHEELTRLAEALAEIYKGDGDREILAGELLVFAREAATTDDFRARRLLEASAIVQAVPTEASTAIEASSENS